MNNVILVGPIVGPIVTDAVDGRPCCGFTIRASRLLVPVQVHSQHAQWADRWLGPGELMCVDGALTASREPAVDSPHSRLGVLACKVEPVEPRRASSPAGDEASDP